ncbi:HipA domain-containing protein [Pseudophaeobacter profundi]|uniref:HipA domain-containing protein n=1 Tax=Pseudophaeobacter profundi TaxID=3034152 RepID=UPI00242EFB36|nr:HipA domain-containing protein [Pseudophaeobacter profundi]
MRKSADSRASSFPGQTYSTTSVTDAHAKNFSVFLSPGGSYRMTPLYDIVTELGALEARQVERKQMKMAMSVGNSRHYRFDQVHGRHFVQTALRAGFSKKRTTGIIEEIAARAPKALDGAANALPKTFPQAIVDTVSETIMARLGDVRLPDKV